MDTKRIEQLIITLSGQSIYDLIAINLFSEGVTSSDFYTKFICVSTKIDHCLNSIYTNNVYNSLRNIETGILKLKKELLFKNIN